MERSRQISAAEIPSARRGRELRTRYVPKARLRMGYLNAVSWLDLLFILFFLVLVQSRLVLRPGVTVALPAYAGSGVQGGSVAVMTYTGSGRNLACIVFFDDLIFRMDDPVRMVALREALHEVMAKEPVATLTLYADQRVPHAYILQMMELASHAGVQQFNLGTSAPTRALQ